MAALLQNRQHTCHEDQKFIKLQENPMFSELQTTLIADLQDKVCIPVSLGEIEEGDQQDGDGSSLDPSLVAVQEASLQSDFQQILPTGNTKVLELKEFYTMQCSQIENDRNNAIFKLKEDDMLSVSQYQRRLEGIHVKFDEQRMHLTNRVTASLQLLKISMPSHCEVSSSKSKSRQLNSYAVAIMTEWYEAHIDNPYPSDEEKQILADMGNLSMNQVKAWFANKRNRTNNTKPKKQKAQVERKLLTICTELAGEVPRTTPRLYGDIIQQLSDIVNSSTVFNRYAAGRGLNSDAFNSSGEDFDTGS